MIELFRAIAMAYWRLPLKDKLWTLGLLCRLLPYVPLLVFILLCGGKDEGAK